MAIKEIRANTSNIIPFLIQIAFIKSELSTDFLGWNVSVCILTIIYMIRINIKNVELMIYEMVTGGKD